LTSRVRAQAKTTVHFDNNSFNAYAPPISPPRVMGMQVEAVLFDLFNTLIIVESGDAFYMPALQKLHKTLTQNNINIPFEDFKNVYFKVRDKLYADAAQRLEEPHFNTRISRTLQEFSIDLQPQHPTIIKATNIFCNEFLKHTHPDPEAKAVLQELRKTFKLGIVSNFAIPQCVHKLLKKHRMNQYFQTVIISAAINKRKPSPIIFQKALQNLDSPPSKTVYVGDTPTTDIQGAHNTGIKAILINRPPLFEDGTQHTQQPQKQHPKPHPDYTIQSLTELPSLLKKT